MKVIKNSAHMYDTLYKTLEEESLSKTNETALRFINTSAMGNKNRFESFFTTISNVNTQIRNLNDVQLIINLFVKNLRTLFTVEEAHLFLFNDNEYELLPVTERCDRRIRHTVETSLKNGIISWVFEKKKAVILPNLSRNEKHAPNLNYLIIPIIERNQKKGILVVQTPLSELKDDSFEMKAVHLLTGLIYPKVSMIINQEKINEAIKESLTYKSKLSNDSKLAAVGELTNGIVEDIMKPTQVIMSCSDFIKNEHSNVDKDVLQTINNQVKKIETVMNRLSKFASVNNDATVTTPCNLNDEVSEYVDVLMSSIKNNNYECILDLGENIPPILSNSNLLNQIFSNLFSLIKNGYSETGGILIQTRFQSGLVLINVFTTDNFGNMNSKKRDSFELSLSIMNNLMRKHEGKVFYNSSEESGTSFSLQFPLKRKLQK
ncbi:MAG: HAMP domain-containing histidine kinase [Melioribacteraceae bacterium]|nr:HAMP domain-containing histidine kinase [Melioribacteraceae bacterium]